MTFLLLVVHTAILRREPGCGATLATFACRYLGAAVPERFTWATMIPSANYKKWLVVFASANSTLPT